MLKDFSQLICDISKINNYWVLKEEKDSAVIGTTIHFHDDHLSEQLFQRVSLKREAEVAIFFIVTIAKEKSELEKLFAKASVPVLVIKNKKEMRPLNNLKNTLSEFTETKIKSWKQVGYNL